eukprot:CAMPEP_0174990306 /NCGR_PEP_ID=MMETSP0004_2-20121128/21241_1 /TAXON_ID=420556 /ORGANISM="Ochromonas sp., Strain CCMP1393" /LENGTH=103 /DNA_ID=CAMNT_0016243885 /DNA_START=712 /DNA_END=1023 /DNA_ORIENTATION=-
MSKLSILTPSTTGSAGAAPAVVSAVAPAAVELVLVLVLVAETAGADTARSALLGMSATPGVEAAWTGDGRGAGYDKWAGGRRRPHADGVRQFVEKQVYGHPIE